MLIRSFNGNDLYEVINMEFDISNKAREQLENEFSGKTVRIFPYKKT